MFQIKTNKKRNIYCLTFCGVPSLSEGISLSGNSLSRAAKLSVPLVAMTRKHARLKWTDALKFDHNKQQLTVVSLLAYTDPNKQYILYTDAYDFACGGVFSPVMRAFD